MREYRLKNLTLGGLPRVVGILSLPDSLQVAWPPETTPSDIVELRLDQVGIDQPSWLDTCCDIEALGLPVILTLRMQEEGGKWAKPEADRLPVLERALETLATIDIEWASELRRPLCDQAAELGKPIIVSFHDFEGTPDRGALADIVAEICEHSSAIPKISTRICGAEDVKRLEEILSSVNDRPVCVIGMGSEGRKTRLTFPLQGSGLAYGYLDSSNAPGQLSARTLFESLRQHLPEYNQEAVAQKKILEDA